MKHREKVARRVRLLFIWAVLLCALPLAAGAGPYPDASRFVIVQSTLNLRDTFRVDRWTGTTEILATRDDGTLAWSRVTFLDGAPSTHTAPRYTLTLSTVAAKGAYLIDVDTGRAWFLVETAAKTLAWRTIK